MSIRVLPEVEPLISLYLRFRDIPASFHRLIATVGKACFW
uniref:Uncharacterized protein MANES_04G087400 n=1 Tax=Rhizophora mucronata TaxID=61149 RepID=A0A2P2JJB1_RHIMU